MKALVSKKKSPARRGRPGEAFMPGSPLRRSGQFAWFRQTEPLVDHLNDAAGARLDQHGLPVHHGVAMGRGTIGLRHVVIGDAGFRQYAAVVKTF